jgi:nucleotide-binding universal stress UspA family protein
VLPFKRILVTTDFSEASYAGLEKGGELARWFAAELCVLYVVPAIPALPPGPNYAFEIAGYEEALQTNAEERLRELVQERLGEVNARPMVEYGDAAKEIVRVAGELSVDLIVIATHGLTGWRHLVSGSVTEKVVRLAECPVLTVHAGPAQ